MALALIGSFFSFIYDVSFLFLLRCLQTGTSLHNDCGSSRRKEQDGEIIVHLSH